ncbi:MAG: 23S rRNA (guanosine(2251)-2'-O)-methyltransferase RlmB [Dehalococcoidia bacterium]
MADVIEGRNPVLEALRSGRAINKIIVARDSARRSAMAELLDLARRAKVPVERVDRRAVQRISVTGHSQSVVALAAARPYDDLDGLIAESKRRGEPALYVLLDGIEDPHNLGAVLRTADAAGVHGVVLPARRAAGLTAAVGRASAGAMEYVTVARVPNLVRAMEQLGREQVWTVGVDPAGGRDYTQVDYRQPTAIIIGAEGKGLSRLVKDRCDLLASIPMKGRVASLNASVAAALVMYEAMRQRAAP